MIDAAAGGTLMSKIEEEAYNLIEEMALNNYQWSNEQGQPKKVRGKHEIDALTLLTAKMDAMTQKLDKLNVMYNPRAITPSNTRTDLRRKSEDSSMPLNWNRRP